MILELQRIKHQRTGLLPAVDQAKGGSQISDEKTSPRDRQLTNGTGTVVNH